MYEWTAESSRELMRYGDLSQTPKTNTDTKKSEASENHKGRSAEENRRGKGGLTFP